jgi:hypothetical protein
MIALLLVLFASIRILRNALKDPPFRALAGSVAVVLAIGTVFYASVEGWGVLNSLYFSVVILTTVGLGDFAPKTVPGKVFTIFYLLMGLGFVMAFVTTIIQRSRLWSRIEPAAGEKGEGPDAPAAPASGA